MTKTSGERYVRSHSQLSDYLHCSHAFYLKRIKKVPEAPSVWFVGGRAFHSATEAFDRSMWDAGVDNGTTSIAELRRENDPIVDPEVWLNVFDEQLEIQVEAQRENDPDVSTWRTAGRKTKEKPTGEDLDWWRVAGREWIGKYIDWRASVEDVLVMAAVEGGPGIEIEVTVPFGGVPVVGYVDRLFRDKRNEQCMAVDLKTGSRTPASPLQLAQYSLQLHRKLGIPVTWGAWYDARKGGLSEPIDLSTWTDAKLGRVYDGLDRAVQAGIFLPNIDSFCKACPVRRACVYQGGIEPE